MAQLLLVEDDAAIRDALIRALTERGHAVASTSSAMDALTAGRRSARRIWSSSTWACPAWTATRRCGCCGRSAQVPVVVATARDDEADIVRALDAGADDYLVKPFGAGQIEARVRAVLRRSAEQETRRNAPIEVGGLRLDGEAHEATLDGSRSTSAAASSTCCTTWRCTRARS